MSVRRLTPAFKIFYQNDGGSMKRPGSILSAILKDIYSIRYALLILLPYAIITQIIFHTICPFAIITGLPCPGCGLTRAGILVLTGQFHAATQANATIYLWMPFLIYLFVFRYLLSRKVPLATALTILVCLISLGYFLLRVFEGTVVSVPCNGILQLLIKS